MKAVVNKCSVTICLFFIFAFFNYSVIIPFLWTGWSNFNYIKVLENQTLCEFHVEKNQSSGNLKNLEHFIDGSFNFGIWQGIGAIQIEQAIAEHKMFPLNQSDKATKPHFNSFPESTKKILIVTTWRSGSTFLGEIIHSAPGVFYSYEPLYYFEQHSGSNAKIIESLFQCQFPAEYLQFINGLPENSQNFMKMNRRVWEACQHNRTLCYQPKFVGQLCSFFPIHLIKVVRLRIKEILPLLEDQSSKNLKIVYLVRDPRGVMSSRVNLAWCKQNPACIDPRRLCAEVQEDLDLIKIIKSQFSGIHYLLSFEDLATNVQTETKKLFHFLGIPISDSVKLFLDTHTQSNAKRDNPFSTVRKSNTVASEWKKKLSKNEILNITNICTPLLETLDMI